MTNLKDIYWLAGLLEGEGYFAQERNRARCPRIVLRMTDEDVVCRAHALLRYKASVIKVTSKQPNRKDHWYFSVTGNRAAGWMMTLFPLLGKRRQARILEILGVWKLHLKRVSSYGGYPSSSPEYQRLWKKARRLNVGTYG